MRRPRSLVGRSVSILWNRPSRWYYDVVVGYDARSGEHLVHYHDGDKRWHDLGHEQRSGQLRHSPRSGRRQRAAWPSSEAEAVQRRWPSYPVQNPGGRGKWQLYVREGIEGVGLRLAPQTLPLAMPQTLPADGSSLVLLWFEGIVLKGKDAVDRAVAQQSAEAEAPEPIEADDDDMAFVVKRTGAQLAECAVDPAAANAELLFVPRAGKRVPWPALVQTRAIAPGEPLCWVYNSNPTTPMGRQIRQWRRQEEELQELRASAEAARRQRRTDLNRDIRGRFKKDGRLKCV